MANVLWEFIQARSAALGIKSDQLADDFDIAPITMYRIKQCRPIREETKQKLARALKCCIGDINAAYAGTMPVIKDGEPSVMKTVGKLEQMIEEDYPELSTTKAKKTKQKTPLRAIKSDPPPNEKWPEDPPEEQPSQTPELPMTILPDSVYQKQLEAARQEGAAEYRQKLKDICLRALVKVPILNVSGETPIGMAGRAVMEELLKDDTEAE